MFPEINGETYISIIIFPKPYHCPPAPTKLESFTLRGSALSAFLTRMPKGAGMVKSAQSLKIDLASCPLVMTQTHENNIIYASHIGIGAFVRDLI